VWANHVKDQRSRSQATRITALPAVLFALPLERLFRAAIDDLGDPRVKLKKGLTGGVWGGRE